MNLEDELERRTEPPPKASKVKSLSLEEIEDLALAGKISSLGSIPHAHRRGREVIPAMWNRGCYNRWNRRGN